MISRIIKYFLCFFNRNKQTRLSDNDWTDCGNGVKFKANTSASEALKRSRELRKGTISSAVLFSDDAGEKLESPEALFSPDLDTPLNFRDYKYTKYFIHNNSLVHGGIPLCIGKGEEDIVKQAGAVYCKKQKCWFSPFKSDTANYLILTDYMPKSYTPKGDNILSPNLVPEPLWGENLRKYLSKQDWDFLRKHTYKKSGYRCSICGGKGDKWPVECDEHWDYHSLDDGRGVSVLVGLRALCPRCHRVNHLGKAHVDGKYDETLIHMAYINGWSLNQAEKVAEKSFQIFEERSEKSWQITYDDDCPWEPEVETILKRFFCNSKALTSAYSSHHSAKEPETNSIPDIVLQPKNSATYLEKLTDFDRESFLNFFDYPYLDFCRGDKGIPLCVGPDDLEELKSSRVAYCEEEKYWYWPSGETLYVEDMDFVLPKIYGMSGFDSENPPLTPSLAPEVLHLRKYLSKQDWDFLREHTYKKSGYRCSICGGKGDKWPVECDEHWGYHSLEGGRGVSVLVELRALCPRCHRVNHLGETNIDGKYEETLIHMAYINGWSLNQAEKVAEKSLQIFEERSEKSWQTAYDDKRAWEPEVEVILKRFFCRSTTSY